jgi:hypothetical protein
MEVFPPRRKNLDRCLQSREQRMPSITLHMVLADRVMEGWRETPSTAPFNLDDPASANAFHFGALGPDFGYFPGGHRVLSDLAHLVRSGDLTRELVSSAQTPEERAFAWGWVTHVLADLAIHPLVGRGVGEFLYGIPTIFVDGVEDQMAHLQVETGLDAFYSLLFPKVRLRKIDPVFDGSSIRFLSRAYRSIYGVRLDPALFLTSHLATARMSARALISIGVMSTTLVTRPVCKGRTLAQQLLRRALSAIRIGVGRDSLLLAYLNPVPPTDWLLASVGRVVDTFQSRFDEHFRGALASLKNFNLDSGHVEEPDITHAGTLRTLRLLAKWRGVGSLLPVLEYHHSGGPFLPPSVPSLLPSRT